MLLARTHANVPRPKRRRKSAREYVCLQRNAEPMRAARSIRLTQTCSCINIVRPAVDFLLRWGRFHRRLATTASAFPSTGSHRGTHGDMPYSIISQIDRCVDVAVMDGL